MQNPFEKRTIGNFSKYLREQLQDKKIGDSFAIDIEDRNLSTARAALKNIYVGALATKVDESNPNILWVKLV